MRLFCLEPVQHTLCRAQHRLTELYDFEYSCMHPQIVEHEHGRGVRQVQVPHNTLKVEDLIGCESESVSHFD